jgi:hypothetical protein
MNAWRAFARSAMLSLAAGLLATSAAVGGEGSAGVVIVRRRHRKICQPCSRRNGITADNRLASPALTSH